MSEYVPQVGDRVKLSHWRNADMTVAYVGSEYVVGVLPDGSEKVGYRGEAWAKVPTFPERWINVYAGMTGDTSTWSLLAHASRDAADRDLLASDRIGVIRLHSDGTLTMESAEQP